MSAEPGSDRRAGFVAVIGRPNVGKSTFVNALVGTKVAIVSDKPQTTRNRILAVVNRPGGQMVLFDTPGIHKPEHALNRRMVETAVRSVGMVDVVLWMIDVTERYGPGDRYVRDTLQRAKRPVLLGLNKIDLIPKPHILRVIDQYRNLMDFAEIVPLSALSGDNVELIGERLLAHLPAGDALYPEDFLTDRPERFFVAEMIREQILRLTRQEMPYVTGVLIETFVDAAPEVNSAAAMTRGASGPRAPGPETRNRDLVRIEASILAERDSQKAILIGKGGAMLKEIGTRARQEIEAFLGTRVYLGLFVKVRSSWRENGAVLDEMGLSEGEPVRARLGEGRRGTGPAQLRRDGRPPRRPGRRGR